MLIQCKKCRVKRGPHCFRYDMYAHGICSVCRGVELRKKCVACFTNFEAKDRLGLCEPCAIRRYYKTWTHSMPSKEREKKWVSTQS